jgi:hypothetical protein
VHAKHREAPDVGIDLDFEHVREHVPARIGQRREFGRLAAAGRHIQINGRIAFGRIGQQLDDHVEEFADAGAGFRRGEHHRDQVTLAHRPLQRFMQRLGLDLAFFEVDLHELFVHFDDLFHQRLCASSTEEKSASPEGAKKQSDTLLAFAAGRLSGRHSLPKACWILSSSAGRSTFSASMRLTITSRSRPRFAAHCMKRPVIISMPFCALMTIAAVSTAASAGSACPRKSG